MIYTQTGRARTGSAAGASQYQIPALCPGLTIRHHVQDFTFFYSNWNIIKILYSCVVQSLHATSSNRDHPPLVCLELYRPML